MKIYDLLIDECETKYPGLLKTHSPQTYVEHLRRYPASAVYGHLCDTLRNFCRSVEERYPQEAMALIHKLVMVHFIQTPADRINVIALTEEMENFVKHEHQRIILEFSTEPDEYYSIKNDKFIKDLALCTGRLIYGGTPVFEPYQRIPKKLVVSSGPMNTLRVLKKGGFGPYFQFHTSDKHLQTYNEQGWDGAYKRAAHLLELNPQFKGFFGCAWSYDPVIEKISPRLKYLRSRLMENGGLSLYMSQDRDSESLATRTSPTRKQLFESGKYLPKQYMIIWFREDLLKWARAN